MESLRSFFDMVVGRRQNFGLSENMKKMVTVMNEKIHFFRTYARHYIINTYLIVRFIVRNGIINSIFDLIKYPWLLKLLKANILLTNFTKGRTGRYLEATCLMLTNGYFRND